jgi:hypothetical protein
VGDLKRVLQKMNKVVAELKPEAEARKPKLEELVEADPHLERRAPVRHAALGFRDQTAAPDGRDRPHLEW